MGGTGRVSAVLTAIFVANGLVLAAGSRPALAAPRPVPAPVKVSITPDGYAPPNVTLVAGQTVAFTNDSGVEQTVTATDASFDSGPIAPGGGYAMAFHGTGTFSITSTNTPSFAGTLIVGLLDIPGAPTATVQSSLPLTKI